MEKVVYAQTAEDSAYSLLIQRVYGSDILLGCKLDLSEGLWSDDYAHIRPKWGLKRKKFEGRTDIEMFYDKFEVRAYN